MKVMKVSSLITFRQPYWSSVDHFCSRVYGGGGRVVVVCTYTAIVLKSVSGRRQKTLPVDVHSPSSLIHTLIQMGTSPS
jgi:hypothetical protein